MSALAGRFTLVIVRAKVEPQPSQTPAAPREIVVDGPTYEEAVAEIDGQVGESERVMFYRVDGAVDRWNRRR